MPLAFKSYWCPDCCYFDNSALSASTIPASKRNFHCQSFAGRPTRHLVMFSCRPTQLFITVVLLVDAFTVTVQAQQSTEQPLNSQLPEYQDQQLQQVPSVQQQQQLDHCRYLFQSPSLSSSLSTNSETNVHLFVSPSGRFSSPSTIDNRKMLLQPSRICEFAFIGSPTEKVDITFTDFDFPGHPPQCKRAYLDIVFQSEAAEFRNFVELTHENRYCGKDLVNVPHRLISLHQSIFMLMDTTAMKNNTDGWRGFRGSYSFISARPFDIGVSLPPSASGSNLVSALTSQCGGQLIRSNMTPFGVILSPNYPGMYGDDAYCFWRLVGNPGERIRLTFNDFGLFYGDDQCPFDFVNIYDGYNAWSPLLRSLCGQLRDGDVMLFSRSYEMFIEFVTGRGRYDSRTYAGLPYWMPRDDYTNKRRGFKATFEFSPKIVPLGNILGANAAHVAGSECDQLIQNVNGRGDSGIGKNTEPSATGEQGSTSSTSSIFSPYYPLDSPENSTCTYHFQGRNERDYIDKIRLQIADFGEGSGDAVLNDNLIVTCPYAEKSNEKNGNSNVIIANDGGDFVSDNETKSFYITLHSTGLSSLSGIKAADKNLCSTQTATGNRISLKPGTVIESLGPNLTVTFTSLQSTTSKKRRFLIHHNFVRDFHVATAGVGKQIADYVCHFIFNSSEFADLTLPKEEVGAIGGSNRKQKQFVSFFTSPHFPRPYPTSLRCVYDFIIDRQKYSQLRIWFDLFDVGEGTSFQQIDRLRRCRNQDHVSIYQLLPGPRLTEISQTSDKTYGSYSSISFPPTSTPVLHSVLCGRYLPGPLVSDPESIGFQIVFTSGAMKTATPPLSTTLSPQSPDFRGFRANFEFVAGATSNSADLTANGLNSSSVKFSDCPSKQIVVGRKGAIISPNYPNAFYPARGLVCDWTLQTFTEKARLQIMLTEFEIEGAYNPTVGLENCQNAVVEIYTSINLDQPTIVRCSSASVLRGEIFLSQSNRVRIRFLTSPASTGGPGFRIDWNEIYDVNETECVSSQSRIWCSSASRCLSSDLRCDGIPHCGLLDSTDENNCNPPPANSASLVLIVAGGAAAVLSLIIILSVIFCRLRRQSVRHRQLEKQTNSHISAGDTVDALRRGTDIFDYSNKPRKSYKVDANKGQLANQVTTTGRQISHAKYRKSIEETILIENSDTSKSPAAVSSARKLHLFEKITIV